MSKLIVMVGIPASGKSTLSKVIAEREDALILSSDALRIELFGDVNHQENNGELFAELYRRAKEKLRHGQSVIIDATNISCKRRLHLINEFKMFPKECYYVSVPVDLCLQRDAKRDKPVGFAVIDRMYKSLQVPIYKEGWDLINLLVDGAEIKNGKEYYELAMNLNTSHDYLFNIFNSISEFDSIYNLPQDSKYHSFSVSRHTYYVLDYINKNYDAHDKLVMQWTAMLHDLGKAYCKNFKEDSRYANFIGHENVSGQLACGILYRFGYGKEFILKVVELVQNHMKLLSIGDSEKGVRKLKDSVGEDIFNKLQFFREADISAK